ncbi:unnamed protein product [Cunninghamella blakesleeana]
MIREHWILIYVIVLLAIINTQSFAQDTNELLAKNEPDNAPPPPPPHHPPPSSEQEKQSSFEPQLRQPIIEKEGKDKKEITLVKGINEEKEGEEKKLASPVNDYHQQQQLGNMDTHLDDLDDLDDTEELNHSKQPNNATINIEIPLPEDLVFNTFDEEKKNNTNTQNQPSSNETQVVNPQQITESSINQMNNDQPSSQLSTDQNNVTNLALPFNPALTAVTNANAFTNPTSCLTQGQIAVTYSEGPSDATASVVRLLQNSDARANFFVNATWLHMQQYATVLDQTYKSGHLIGMTYRVKNDDASLWSDDQIREDIINNAKAIESIIKVAPKYVRLHQTQPDKRTEQIIRDLGFILVGYNLDSQDYSHKDAIGPNSIGEVYRSILQHQKQTYGFLGSFISIQYDIPDTNAAEAVPFMVNTINDLGYMMVRLDGCLNDPAPYKKCKYTYKYIYTYYIYNLISFFFLLIFLFSFFLFPFLSFNDYSC